MNAKKPMMNWQSIRSVIPPWPGIDSPKSLTLNVRFSPEAKKPPKGAMSEAKVAKTSICSCMGATVTVVPLVKGSLCGVGLNTGLGVQERPVRKLAPRSWIGFISGMKLKDIEFRYITVDKYSSVSIKRRGERTYIYGANEVFITHEDVCHAVTEHDCGDPCANEALNRFFRGKLDEHRAPKNHAA